VDAGISEGGDERNVVGLLVEDVAAEADGHPGGEQLEGGETII